MADEIPQQPSVGVVTRLLDAARNGQSEATEKLVQCVYAELRGMARARLRSGASDTLQPTALVHEAWMRLLGREVEGASFENRRHFFGAAARAMRDIVVEEARRRVALKRGGGRAIDPLQTGAEIAIDGANDVELLAIHEALDELSAAFPRAAEVVQQRYFAGLGEQDVADALGVSRATVAREWRFARAWLREHVETP